MKCPNCKKETYLIHTDHDSGYPLDDDRSKRCHYCSTKRVKSLRELNEEYKKLNN